MAAQVPSDRSVFRGPAGSIEVAAYMPSEIAPRAIAVVAHPHPLFGGTMDNKVVTTIARTMFDAGAAVFRFNFRGVGNSEGVHDEGRGETEDLLIHGENDETVQLADSMDWARSRDMAVTVVPGADHFFHMRLHIIKRLVAGQLR